MRVISVEFIDYFVQFTELIVWPLLKYILKVGAHHLLSISYFEDNTPVFCIIYHADDPDYRKKRDNAKGDRVPKETGVNLPKKTSLTHYIRQNKGCTIWMRHPTAYNRCCLKTSYMASSTSACKARSHDSWSRPSRCECQMLVFHCMFNHHHRRE